MLSLLNIGTNIIFLLKDTGCGKTTVVQLMSVLLNRELQIVNCHASTETSDLLGGLRPLRGRRLIMEKLITAGNRIFCLLNNLPALNFIEVPELLKFTETDRKEDFDDIPPGAAQQIISFIKVIRSSLQKLDRLGEPSKKPSLSQCEKRRKLEKGDVKNGEKVKGFRQQEEYGPKKFIKP